MEHTAVSFPEAVRILANSVGMAVPQESLSPRRRAEAVRRREEASRHTQVLEAALDHYQKQLPRVPEAMRYLKKRGLDGETATRFGLGWADADRQGLAKVFANYGEATLVETGLIIESEDGRRYDRFRERVMFPIRNARGALIGFGGRIIGKGEPKYLNSPETPLFSKGNELYGLWENRQGIRRDGRVIVVEGYMDVVGLAQLGIDNAVATLGTATTPAHVQKLLRASDRIVFSFDGDAAGRRAAWRALQACLPLLRDDVSIRFLFLPDPHDPDSYVREFGAEAFRAALSEAKVLSRFLLDELASHHRLDEAEGRAACVHEAQPLLDTIPEGTLRLQIQRELAQLVRLTPEELTEMFASTPPTRAGYLDGLSASDGGVATRNKEFDAGEAAQHISPSPFAEAGATRSRREFGRRGAAPRPVASLVRQMARLVVAHPELVEVMGDQQLEIFDRGPHLRMVRDLILLARSSGAKHLGGLVAAADPGSDLADMLNSMAADVLVQEDLPDPQTEWEDALRRVEIEALTAEQTELAQSGLSDPVSQDHFRELTRRLMVLKNGKIR